MSNIQLYLGDCLEVMKNIPDHSIDMILCDLPYGTTPLDWDKEIPLVDLWEQYKRVAKDNCAIVLFGQEPFSSHLRMSNLSWYKYDWYWEKESFTNVFQVKRRPGKNIETVSVFYDKQPTYNPQKEKHNGKLIITKIGENARFPVTQSGSSSKVKPTEYHDDGTRYPRQVIRINRDPRGKALHPTQKPVELCEYLIRTYSQEGDTVLDNCMGSGSTGVACIRTGRNFVGIEKEEKYFEIAKKRIEEERKSFSLWE